MPLLSSDLPIDRWGGGNQRQVHALQRLGMACEEISARSELPCKFLKKPDLCRPIEVDDDVPAEDDLRRLGQAEVRVHEVNAPKLDQCAQFGNHKIGRASCRERG